MRYLRRVFLFLLLFAAAPFVPSASGQKFSFRTFLTGDGLPSSRVTALIQDARGYLWVGTDNGIALFDGNSFTTLSTMEGLENPYVVQLLESRAAPGTVWIGTIAGGLFRYRGGVIAKVFDSPNPRERYIRSIVEEEDGSVWITTAIRAFHLRGDSIVSQLAAADTINGVLMADAGGGGLYISDGRFLELRRRTASTRIELPVRRGAGVITMTGNGRGSVWLSTADSLLIRVKEGRIERTTRLGTVAASMQPVGDSVLWIAGYSEVLSLDAASLAERSRIDGRSGIPNLVTGPAFVDREGSLWIGFWQDGLRRLSRPSFASLDVVGDDRNDRANHGIFDPRGMFWLGTNQGLVEMYRDASGAWRRHLHDAVQGGSGQGYVAVDQTGLLYVASYPGLGLRVFSVDPSPGGPSTLRLLRRLTAPHLEGAGIVSRVDVGRSGRVYLCADPKGLQIREPGTLRLLGAITPADSAPGPALRAAYDDGMGRLWLGGYNSGLSLFDGSGRFVRRFGREDGLPDPGVRSIAEDALGGLWVGTRYGGVARFEGRRFEAVSQRDGMRSNAAWALAPEPGGTLWVGTTSGLERVDIRTRSVLRHIPELMGEPMSACGLLDEGTVWGLTPRRLLLYRFSADRPNAVPPPVHVTSISVNGVKQPIGGRLELGPDQNNVLINYIGISLREENSVSYAHRIGGPSAGWSATSDEHSVLLAGLPPGTHEFEVKAINADGVESPAPASVTFTIVPPVWRRWWFISLSALAILALVGVAVRYVATQELLRKIALLEREKAVEAERASTRDRIARDLHDEVASTLASIALYAEALKRPGAGGDGAPPDTLDRIEALTQEAEESMGDIIWSTSPSHDRLADLAARIRRDALDLCGPKGIRVTFDMPEAMPHLKLKDDVRKSFYLVAKEALNNAAKHSRAKEVRVGLRLEEGVLRLSVADDGSGIAAGWGQDGVRGHGMRNMRRRAEEASARLAVESREGEGTTITLVTAMT